MKKLTAALAATALMGASALADVPDSEQPSFSGDTQADQQQEILDALGVDEIRLLTIGGTGFCTADNRTFNLAVRFHVAVDVDDDIENKQEAIDQRFEEVTQTAVSAFRQSTNLYAASTDLRGMSLQGMNAYIFQPMLSLVNQIDETNVVAVGGRALEAIPHASMQRCDDNGANTAPPRNDI